MKRHLPVCEMLPAVLTLATLAFAQDRISPRPCPDLSAESMGCELIVWSDAQEPTPPEPASFPEQRSEQTTFVGTITGSNGLYFLRAGDNSLALDDSSMMRQYEGQVVRITGAFEKNSRKLHVKKVDPLA